MQAESPPGAPARPFQLQRRGVVLRPDLTQPFEQGGVLNPAAVSRGGLTYIYYRSVALAPTNYSRILMATTQWTPGAPPATRRLDHVALAPEAPYEVWANGAGGGVEDPRVTPLDGRYYMAYTAYGTVAGVVAPRIALARSADLFHWERLGLARFHPWVQRGAGPPVTWDLQAVPNKDAILFPERIGGRYALLHRPMFPVQSGLPQSIWLSWSEDLRDWQDHQIVLAPTLPWESLKVGGGTPPLRTPLGWVTFYHGVEGRSDTDPARRYHAGVLVLDLADPARVRYQSPQPVLSPEAPDETVGVVSNVVFPTGVVLQADGRLDVYYGMADQAIGLATTILPATLFGEAGPAAPP